MPLKENARKNFIFALKKENLDIDVEALDDKELKALYVKMQHINQGYCKLQVPKKMDFEDAIQNQALQYVTFKGVTSLRRMTFKEYLRLEEFAADNPDLYPYFEPYKK